MFCKNCGSPLSGTETVCPNCNNPIVMDQQINTPNNMVGAQEVQPAASPVIQSQPVQQPVMQQPVTPNNNQPKKSMTKTLILVIAMLVVILIAVILYFTVFRDNTSEPAPSTPTNETTNDSSKTTNANTASYSGYTFTVPEGYTAKNDATYGLVMTNGDFVFSIQIDFSHSYSDYIAAAKQQYPDTTDYIANILGREFIVLQVSDESGGIESKYYTKLDDSKAFIGAAARNDGKASTTTDFEVVTNTLNSAKVGDSSFAADSKIDAGKDGIKLK